MNNANGQLSVYQLGLWSKDDDVLVFTGVQKRPGERGRTPADAGTLESGNKRRAVRGRALTLIECIVDHQERINTTASSAGQLWLSWKGDGQRSITGDIKAPL